MKLVLASKNPHKLQEISAILGTLGIEVVLQSELGVDVDVEETGTTFEENSFLKAEAVMKASGLPAGADDSGLMVDALGGEPGVYSARYGGLSTDDERIDYLLKNLEGAENRGAQFVCCITALWPDGRKIVATGIVRGRITTERQGCDNFGYDPVFYLPEYGCTYAQMDRTFKNGISHRAKALREFVRQYHEDTHYGQ